MKKTVFIFVSVLVLSFVSAQDLAAQTDIAWNWGLITDKDFKFSPFLWTTGLTFDFYLSPQLSISPEVFMTVHNFDFGAFFLAPAVLVNFEGKGFFLGGGATKYWMLGKAVEGAPPSDWMAKLNFGIRGYDIKFTFFAVTPFTDFFKDVFFGVTFGFYF